MTTTNAQPLNTVAPGATVRVVSLEGGRGFRGRLINMGVKVGSRVKVLRRGGGGKGPSLVAVGGMRLALGYGMAARIFVTPENRQGRGHAAD